ncbi:MAG: HAD-IC family P-type ATPase, partial [Anaerolineae bacterium]|nr:HAD-IC family P-type ATPase [Anaerolineae bacterium]
MLKVQQVEPAADSSPRGWHTSTPEETLIRLNVLEDIGLTPDEVEKRLEKYGRNELTEGTLKSPFAILWEQIREPLVLILIFAAVVAGALGKVDSVIAISAIVVLNAVLGVVQEYRAEKAMAALKNMSAPSVRVRRSGQVQEVSSKEIVPGDIILLEAGNIVPADARLLEVMTLRVQEASLTGESYPIDKTTETLYTENMTLGDRKNLVYMGTSVTYGRGTAVVTATGMKTELGRIAELIQGVENDKSPLQKRMEELGKALMVAAALVMVMAFIVGLIGGRDVRDILLTSVAIAVAVVPEGLPAVVTISLALGAQRMLKQQALIRKLPAVETLGSVTTICSDKTGTLTENRMTVKIIDVAGHKMDLTPYTQLSNRLNGKRHQVEDPSQTLLLAAGTLCNDALLIFKDDVSTEAFAQGDPTEGAIVIAAAHFNLVKPELEQLFPRIGEVPFSSERRRMTTIHRLNSAASVSSSPAQLLKQQFESAEYAYVVFTKGAVDSLLEECTHVWVNGQMQPLDSEHISRIEKGNDELAREGLRVLGVAFRPLRRLPVDENWEEAEKETVFVGLIGMIDPPRPEVRNAVKVSRTAGIRPIMITGDHPLTAQAIARDLGIIQDVDTVLTGRMLTDMSDADLEESVKTVSVYARVSPEHKLRIVRALQKQGQVVAMTGDGVNDAPALKQADIGVAMGITGTDVSKEASDMVILDDNFTTIVHAVEEGRTIYDNVRRFIKYLLASNTGELFVLLATQLISGMTLPLTTLQILWMNLITDGIPALALGLEKAEKNAMTRPPYKPNASVLGYG